MAADVQTLAFAAADYQTAHARWPTPAELWSANPKLAHQDPWQHDFRFEVGEKFEVHSAGLDGKFDTTDDVVSDLLGSVVVPPSSTTCPAR